MLPDLRFALRSLAKTPGFTATVVLVLALGIGATTAIFSIVHAILLNPFPYQRGNEILFVGSNRIDQPGSQMSVTYPDFLDWRKAARTAEHLTFASGGTATLTGVAEPATLRQASISADAWGLLGMQPALGRVFTAAEDDVAAPPVVVLSHATWRNRFGADPAVLGRAITLEGRPYTVIGVMPANFKFWAGDVWTPIGLQADTDFMRSRVLRMDTWVVTRPKPGHTADDVLAELNVIARQLGEQYPDTNKGTGVTVNRLAESVAGPMREPLMVLLAAVVGVLLIACANVANLLLARMTTRRREFSVRAALGADRGRLLRQVLAESLPLAAFGGVAGVILAIWGLEALLAIIPREFVPAEAEIRVNAPVLAFSLVLTLGTTILFALFPALEGSRAALAPHLNESSRGTAGTGTGRVRAGLIVTEVALSLMLLVAAGLLVRSFQQLSRVDLGFNRANLVVAPVQLPAARYGGIESPTAFFEQAVERLAALPVVAHAASASNAPFMNGTGMPLLVEGKTYATVDDLRGVQFSLITPDYFRAQGLRLLRGRGFSADDRAGGAPVVVLNEAAVKLFLPDGDPLGRRVMLGIPENLVQPGMLPEALRRNQWATVVGVVASARHFGAQNDPPPAVYVPQRQGWEFAELRRFMILTVRTRGEPSDAVPMIRDALRSLDPDLPMERIVPMDMVVGDSLVATRFNTLLLGIFAAVALALAAVGIYGVVAWNVTQRTKEIGVRLALGADRAAVLRLVLTQSMKVVGLGVLIGLAASLATARLLQRMLPNLSAFDPLTFAAVVLVLVAAALLACWIPARRATRVDPMVALRAE